jgi:hypothetical protein
MSTPTEAHQELLALFHRLLIEVARRRQEDLPGLAEAAEGDIVVNSGMTTRAAHGLFVPEVWRHGDRRVHELFLNADRRAYDPTIPLAESVLRTLLHEGCHLYAHATGIQGTSRQGRYHGRRFAEIALVIGLAVEKDPVIGHRTPRLSSWARVAYADLLAELDHGLVLAREPWQRDLTGTKAATGERAGIASNLSDASMSMTKYVFASCQCRDRRGRALTIRVGNGSWRAGVICCSACQTPFAPSL